MCVGIYHMYVHVCACVCLCVCGITYHIMLYFDLPRWIYYNIIHDYWHAQLKHIIKKQYHNCITSCLEPQKQDSGLYDYPTAVATLNFGVRF